MNKCPKNIQVRIDNKELLWGIIEVMLISYGNVKVEVKGEGNAFKLDPQQKVRLISE